MFRFLRFYLLYCMFFWWSPLPALAQNTTLVLDTTMFSADQQIYLASSPNWVYHPGHNLAWASPGLNSKDWIKRTPGSLTIKDADQSGRAEGWFRLRLQLDSTFKGVPVLFRKSGFAAADLYVDGHLLASYGSTGTDERPYQEFQYVNQLPIPVKLIPGRSHLIALHLVDYPHPLTLGKLKSETGVSPPANLRLVGLRYVSSAKIYIRNSLLAMVFTLAVLLVISLLLWLLFSQKLGAKEKVLLGLLAVQVSLVALSNAYSFATLMVGSWHTFIGDILGVAAGFLSVVVLLPIFLQIVDHPLARRSILILPLSMATIVFDTIIFGRIFTGWIIWGFIVLGLLYVLISFRGKLEGAQWAIVSGLLLAIVSALTLVVTGFLWPNNQLTPYSSIATTGYVIALPLSFLVYVALRFKEILTEVRTNASTVLQMTEEKRELLATQNQILEEQVEARTTELKASQAQLIQKEKLASLGELTAGIAHEIQNPLNFVNNFSEVSADLVGELKEEALAGHTDDVLAIADDLARNLQKITLHGGRASSIVKGMLEHSRTGSGEKRPTDINALCDEYLKIAYHGLKAKNTSFNCELVTGFDPDLGKVDVVPQEIGRVLLNLYNNAFYAVKEQRALGKGHGLDYQPTVWVSTKRFDKHVEIRVKDNGTGIPDSVKSKIFQPFFTTKPTGEGTGLGLSLSYDIITKGHGGGLTVESHEGSGTEFVVQLPTE